MSVEEQAFRRFVVFMRLMWSWLGLPPPTRAQEAFANYLQYGPQKRGILAFRGVGKSWVTASYTLWKLWTDPQRKELVISASGERAKDFSTFVKRCIADWPLLSALRPNDDQRDSVLSFDVGPSRPAQAPSMKSSGIKGQITGTRAHDIVFDDVEVPSNAGTVGEREKLRSLVQEGAAVIIPDDDLGEGVAPTTTTYLGTPQTEDTLYAILPERGYDIRIWPARYPDKEVMEAYEAMGARLFPELLEDIEEHGLEALQGKPTDTRFGDQDLLGREKEYGRTGWAMQFMLNPALSDAERYPLKLRDLVVAPIGTGTLLPDKVLWSGSPQYTLNDMPSVGLAGDRYQGAIPIDSVTYAGEQQKIGYSHVEHGLLMIDPSGRGPDETSWSVTRVLNGQVFLQGCGGFRGDGHSEKVLEALAKLYLRYECDRVRIESNFGDGMYTRLLSPVFKRITGKALDPEDVEFKNTGIAKEQRIIDVLEPVMAQHKLIVDEDLVRRDFTHTGSDGDARDERQHRMLFHQMSRISRERGALKFDDRLDSVAMAVHHWMEWLGKDVDGMIKKQKDKELDEVLDRWREDAGLGKMKGIGGSIGRIRRSKNSRFGRKRDQRGPQGRFSW